MLGHVRVNLHESIFGIPDEDGLGPRWIFDYLLSLPRIKVVQVLETVVSRIVRQTLGLTGFILI